jgi:O-antigen ligase
MSAVATATTHADRAARWSAIALGFSIPISAALDGVLTGVVLAAWLASGSYREKLDGILRNPVALAALLLYAMLIVGALYGERFPGDTTRFLGKYADLLLIPVFAYCLRDATDRSRALYALAASLVLTLALSFVVKTGWLPELPVIKGDAANASVFKKSLSHNILISFGAFLFMTLALGSATPRARWLWVGLAFLATVNVLLMVQGRTGYVILGALAFYGGYCWKGWRGLGATLAAAAVLGAALAATPNPARDRVVLMIEEAQAWQPGKPNPTSIGLRLEYYRNSIAIVGDHPVAGAGTGSFPKAYAEKTRGTGVDQPGNPHNEYLLVAMQTGLIGLVLLFHLFWQHWRLAPRLATPLETHLAHGLLVTIAVGCLFNSLLLDHTEGLLFAWMTGLLYGGLQSPASKDQGTGSRSGLKTLQNACKPKRELTGLTRFT